MKNKKKAMLAALLLSVTTLSGCNLTSCNKTNGEDLNRIERQAQEDSEYAEAGKKLYDEIKSNPVFRGIKWDKNLALKVVELLNEHYPTASTYMNSENAKNATDQTLKVIEDIIRINLDPNTKPEQMINLSDYVERDRHKAFLNNSMILTKDAVEEIMAGKFIDETKWSSNEKVKSATSSLLNYEFDTTNDSDFLEMSAGVRFTIQTMYNEANKYVPEESYIHRNQSEETVRDYDLYLIYFTNDLEKRVYLPRRTKDNEIEFVYTYPGCKEEERYTKEEMYALAGLSSFEEQKRLGIEPKLWIWQMGIQVEIENRIEDAKTEIYNAKDAYVLKK